LLRSALGELREKVDAGLSLADLAQHEGWTGRGGLLHYGRMNTDLQPLALELSAGAASDAGEAYTLTLQTARASFLSGGLAMSGNVRINTVTRGGEGQLRAAVVPVDESAVTLTL
jgi:hypothetical protein